MKPSKLNIVFEFRTPLKKVTFFLILKPQRLGDTEGSQ